MDDDGSERLVGEAASWPESRTKSTRNILIVAPETFERRRLAWGLERAGFATRCAGDTISAFRAAVEARPTLAVTEVRLGGRAALDGLTLLHHLVCAGLRCVVATRYGSFAAEERAFSLGAVGFLEEPFAIELLAALAGGSGFVREPLPAEPTLARAEWETINRRFLEKNENLTDAADSLGVYARSLRRKLMRPAPARSAALPLDPYQFSTERRGSPPGLVEASTSRQGQDVPGQSVLAAGD